MVDTLRILAQSNPAADTLTDTYTVPVGKSSVISSLVVANRAGTKTKFRISVSKDGEADDLKHYLYYNVEIDKNDTFVATIGVSLDGGDVIRVYADDANLSFSVFGVEI